jgi:flavin reductase (DIM6/NTAB) family NADH-FMN oxidoreductase RutF
MIDSDTFRSVLGRFASGVTIVTTRDDNGADHGMTVSAFCSVSLDPPLVLICIDHSATMYRLLHGHRRFGISILSSEQEAYSRRFAADPDTGRFDGIAYSRGESGVVLLDNALAHPSAMSSKPRCRPFALCGPSQGADPLHGRPLLHYQGGYAQLER